MNTATTMSSESGVVHKVLTRRNSPGVDRLRLYALLLRLGLLVILVAAWQIAVSSGAVGSMTLATPLDAVKQLRQVTDAGFWVNARSTGIVVVSALLIGAVTGLAAGSLFWRLPALGDAVEPFLVTLYATPTLVFYPVLIVFFGLNLIPLILIASVMVFMPIALNTMLGLRNLNPVLPRLAESLGSTGVKAFRKVLLPGAGPVIFAGVRVGFLYATMGTIAMEMVVASSGLGYQLGLDYSNFRTDEMYGLVLCVAILAMGLNWVLTKVERSIRKDLA